MLNNLVEKEVRLYEIVVGAEVLYPLNRLFIGDIGEYDDGQIFCTLCLAYRLKHMKAVYIGYDEVKQDQNGEVVFETIKRLFTAHRLLYLKPLLGKFFCEERAEKRIILHHEDEPSGWGWVVYCWYCRLRSILTHDVILYPSRFRCNWQGKEKLGARTLLGGESDGAAELFNDCAGDIESDTGALGPEV